MAPLFADKGGSTGVRSFHEQDDTDVCADLSLETTCVKSWEASGTRQSDTLWLISTTSRRGEDIFHLLMLHLYQPV
jgi:hypothetical protein